MDISDIFNPPFFFCLIIVAAFIIYLYVMRKLSRNKKTEEQPRLQFPEPSSPIPFQSILGSSEEAKSKGVTLENLLSNTIQTHFEYGELEVTPRIVLSNEGEYEVLGKKCQAKVKIRIRPKRKLQAASKAPEQKKLEEFPNEKEEVKEEVLI